MPAVYFTVIPADFATSDEICQFDLSNCMRQSVRCTIVAFYKIFRRLIKTDIKTTRVN